MAFYEELKDLLSRYQLRTEHVNDITSFVRKCIRESKQRQLQQFSQCILCGSKYKLRRISQQHMVKGDSWLETIWNRFLDCNHIEDVVNSYTGDYITRGLATKSFLGAMCVNCSVEVFKEGRRIQKLRKEELEIAEKEENSIVRDFLVLKNAISLKECEQLKMIPYSEFLKTKYWKTVRDYVIYALGNKCTKCGNKKNLHVHHMSYEERGMEVFDPFATLTSLCKDCHKFEHFGDE